ncbi:energy transducer TonB [Undibacterium sp. FT147W]|uniref:Protein TonB n=1 Tax=Undibacterium rivi TaxID=2828729 RepID=A0ABS5H2U1_9BURK|nr:energy transducer TonB [Undibacterium rivi]MBR7793031.1 energy transducer TonB [Undibacterium rivi]
MNKVVQQPAHKRRASAFAILCTGVLITACSKTPPPEEPPKETAASAASGEMPTGLVKNPVNHGHVADVTKWMDQASNKTAAQIAQEEKLLKEAKEKEKEKQALEAKRAQESKAPPAKPTPVAREVLAAASTPAPTPAPVVTKPVEAAPVVAAAPAPVVAKAAEPERIVLKLLNSVQPKYPASAARAGVTEGVVSAKIHVEPDGKVSQVEILKARPPRHFDKEVIATVMQWKYAPISRAQTTVTEFNFKID